MAVKINRDIVQDLWNCGDTDEEILEGITGDFSLKDIAEAREELGLYENRKKENENNNTEI